VAKSDPVDLAADELYGLPRGEFTRVRDVRAKEVKSGGDREAADAIKGLRKPTVAAWALNQLARRRAKDVERLVEAGEELRAAQEELLAGGDRAAFQEAASRERELVADLSAGATAMASEEGERGSGLQEKIARTLHAAALDEETADELRAGRLVREREAIGGFGAPGDGPPPSTKPTKPTTPRRAKRGRSRSRPGRAAADRQQVTAARTDERHARRELEAATRALEHAQERAEAAEAHAAEATERARTTKERLREAKRAEAAARKAHARAERALESAEKGSSRSS
jgi:hypothetical protein